MNNCILGKVYIWSPSLKKYVGVFGIWPRYVFTESLEQLMYPSFFIPFFNIHSSKRF